MAGRPVRFTDAEVQYMNKSDICRLGTASKGGQPHVVPVSPLYNDGFVYIAVDYGTRKLANLRENPKAAFVIDSFRPIRGLLVQGPVEIIERGEEYREIYRKFHSRFAWVRDDPWKEGEAPFVRITPSKKVSWGFRREQTVRQWEQLPVPQGSPPPASSFSEASLTCRL